MRLISIVTPCFNEEENINEIYNQVKKIFQKLPNYKYEHIFIDNASSDKTVALIKAIAKDDKNVKLIVNARNFGPVRSAPYGLLQAKGDAVIQISADLQDPPELIIDFLKKWEEGCQIVVATKRNSCENKIMHFIRSCYYKFIKKISNTRMIEHFAGFALYDRSFVETFRSLNDPYPYFRGLVSDLGTDIAEIEYLQPTRKFGHTKANFYVLFDWLMLAITSYSRVPIRVMTILGFALSVLSLITSFVFLILKLIFWKYFSLGMAPILISMFFFASIQLFFTGMLGEYIASIHTQVKNRPLVIEKERVNFD